MSLNVCERTHDKGDIPNERQGLKKNFIDGYVGPDCSEITVLLVTGAWLGAALLLALPLRVIL